MPDPWINPLPPDTRITGGPAPAIDMDGVVDAISAGGLTLSVLNPAYAGGADPGAAADSAPAINAALAAAPSGSVVLVPPGIYKINSPLVFPSTNGVTLAGTGTGAAQGGGGSPGVGTLIKPSGTFAQGGAAANAAIVYGAGARQTVRDLWVYGTLASSLAGVEGIDVSSAGNAPAIYRVGVNNMPSWGVYAGQGAAGFYVDTMIIQNCGANPGTVNLTGGYAGGFYSNIVDSAYYNIHAQTITGNGIVIRNNDQRLLFCRADICTQAGFNLASFNGQTYLGEGHLMIGCATQGNQAEGCLVSGGGASTYGPYILIGCQFTGDGQAGSTAAIRADGRVTLSITDCLISGSVVAYGLATSQNSGTHAVPDLVTVNGGLWQVQTAFINDAGPATQLVVGTNLRGVIGAVNGTTGTTPFVRVGATPGQFL